MQFVKTYDKKPTVIIAANHNSDGNNLKSKYISVTAWIEVFSFPFTVNYLIICPMYMQFLYPFSQLNSNCKMFRCVRSPCSAKCKSSSRDFLLIEYTFCSISRHQNFVFVSRSCLLISMTLLLCLTLSWRVSITTTETKLLLYRLPFLAYRYIN